MRLLCFFNLFVSFLFALSVGFNYSYDVPREAFYTYDWLVINDDVKRIYPTISKLIGYVDVGEQDSKEGIKKSWIIGENKRWHSYVMDIRNKEYQDYLIKKMKKMSYNFDGFFFDTLDSYELTSVDKTSYKKALIKFFKRVKKIFKGKILIYNRGFDIAKVVKPTAVVAENLFEVDGKPLSESEKRWIIEKLNEVKKDGIIPIGIEYVTPYNQKDAIKIAKKIRELGFLPYVGDINLKAVGVSNTYLIPRKILIVYDEEAHKEDSLAHTMVSMPLEFFGYVPKLVSYKHLPKDTSIYQAIIVVLESGKSFNNLAPWYKEQIKKGKKILFLGDFGLDDLSFLGIETFVGDKKCKLESKKINPFEANFVPTSIYYYPKDAKNLITYKCGEYKNVIAAKTKWGGYFVNPFVEFGDYILWRVNPFDFIPYVLDLPREPLPDYTTENGGRIWYSHLDGDGFFNMHVGYNKFSAEVVYEKIFKKYNKPFSASIIVGTFLKNGPYPLLVDKGKKVLKKIYKLKNVEPATHTFSHPFDWQTHPIPHLPIKGYKFSFYQEVVGAAKILEKWINKPVREVFWSGNCNPSKDVLKLAYENGIFNMNGKDTYITYDKKFLMLIAPLGIWKGDYFQIYGQIANEEIFTDLWKNKAGYVKAIQTMKLTDDKYRLKPIDVYFHYYIGSTDISLWSLKKVLKYSLSQKIVPMFASDFIKVVLDFENSVMIRGLDGEYYFRNDSNLRTLKIKGKVNIDMVKSQGVIGYDYLKGYTYIWLDNSTLHKIVFGRSKKPYLIFANKRLLKKRGNEYIFDNRFGRLKIKFHLQKKCKISKKHFKVKVICK